MLKRIQQLAQRQLAIVVAGSFLLLALLFPPWRINHPRGTYEGHGFILAPSIVFAIKGNGIALSTEVKRLTIDFSILLLECAVITVAGFLAFFVLKPKA